MRTYLEHVGEGIVNIVAFQLAADHPTILPVFRNGDSFSFAGYSAAERESEAFITPEVSRAAVCQSSDELHPTQLLYNIEYCSEINQKRSFCCSMP